MPHPDAMHTPDMHELATLADPFARGLVGSLEGENVFLKENVGDTQPAILHTRDRASGLLDRLPVVP